MALPYALRPILAAQASKLLRARVEIGDVDLALLRGGIALEDVAVRPADAAPGATEPPLIAWKRFAVALRWLPLFRHTVRLRTLELDSPRIALDRLESGELNLLALVPATEPSPAPPSATPAPPSAWGVGIDRLVLRDGGVRFRDFTIHDLEPVEIALGTIEIADVALRPGLYGEPARLHLGARVDEGRLRIDARLTLRDDGVALETDVRTKRLPLRRTRVYVPNVGWSDLRGELTAALAQRFAPGTRNTVHGTVILDDVTVRVPDVDEPALAWKRLALHLESVDLAARRVAVRAVELAGASLLVRPQGGDLLPFLTRAARDQAAADQRAAAGAAPPANENGVAADATPPTSPWRWAVASLLVADSRVRLVGMETPVDVGVKVDAHALAGDAATAAPVKLDLMVSGGSVVADGALSIAPPGFEGTVKIERLELPELIAAAGALPPRLVQKGSLDAELAIAAGTAAAPGDARVHGKLTLTDLWMAGADPTEFAVGARALDLAIDDLALPGILATDRAAAAPKPFDVRLGELRLAAPYVQLTRTAEGLVLPFGPQAARAAPAPAVTGAGPTPDAATTAAMKVAAPTPTAATVPPYPAPETARPPTAVELALAALRVTEGRVGVIDRTVQPFYTGTLAALDVDVRDLRWPVLAMSRLRLTATSAEQGRIEVTGALAADGSGHVEVNGQRIALRPFNPYATSLSAYSVARGTLSVTTKATFGKGRYDATSSLTLHDFDVGSHAGDSVFQEQFGIPLSMALALLRDLRGDIALDIPVQIDPEGTKIGILSVVGGVLRRALLNALASPLKLVGAVLRGDKVEAAPAPIAFRAGRDVLAPAGTEQVEQLAAFLAGRPGIAVTLVAPPSTQDVRWLREQALREELAAPQGIFGTVKNLRERGARERIRVALEARAHDDPGPLEPEDVPTLERWLAERPPLAPERLRALQSARLARVETLLRDQHGITRERMARREPEGEPTDEAPAVRFEIGSIAAAKGP
jgi:hypothetical protein